MRRDRKFESSVQLVGFAFGSLLCTTEASNVQVIFRCSHTDTAPSAAEAKTDDEDDDPLIFSSDSASEDAQTSTKSSKIKGQ